MPQMVYPAASFLTPKQSMSGCALSDPRFLPAADDLNLSPSFNIFCPSDPASNVAVDHAAYAEIGWRPAGDLTPTPQREVLSMKGF